MSSPFFWLLLGYVPSGILALVLGTYQHAAGKRGLRAPVSDKLLRPPGESCRKKMEELDDKLGNLLLLLMGFPAGVLFYHLSNNGTQTQWVSGTIAGTLGCIFTLWIVLKMLATLKERDAWRLGFRGERFVGEQINQLMLHGCRVFHDVPLDGKGNIDHVVVAPSGVFAIETKAKRKSTASDTQRAQDVIYDGQCLEFPFYRGTRDLDQARVQAERLDKILNPLLLDPVIVQPILTLPGWFVISRALGDVIVVNPKMLESAILSPSHTPLSPDRIREISYILEQRCRDVEF